MFWCIPSSLSFALQTFEVIYQKMQMMEAFSKIYFFKK